MSGTVREEEPGVEMVSEGVERLREEDRINRTKNRNKSFSANRF